MRYMSCETTYLYVTLVRAGMTEETSHKVRVF